LLNAVTEEAKRNLLRRAADLIGREELAIRLKVPATLLDAWINGHATMPTRKLVLLAQILEDLSGSKQ
jgi:hypothetical protein